MKGLMQASNVLSYFQQNNLVGNFWNVSVFKDGLTWIPSEVIKEAIGEEQFRKMECEVTTWITDLQSI